MSRFEDPVVITCAISGAVADRDQCPAIPRRDPLSRRELIEHPLESTS